MSYFRFLLLWKDETTKNIVSPPKLTAIHWFFSVFLFRCRFVAHLLIEHIYSSSIALNKHNNSINEDKEKWHTISDQFRRKKIVPKRCRLHTRTHRLHTRRQQDKTGHTKNRQRHERINAAHGAGVTNFWMHTIPLCIIMAIDSLAPALYSSISYFSYSVQLRVLYSSILAWRKYIKFSFIVCSTLCASTVVAIEFPFLAHVTIFFVCQVLRRSNNKK